MKEGWNKRVGNWKFKLLKMKECFSKIFEAHSRFGCNFSNRGVPEVSRTN